ncbi:hypothetical protein C0991_006375 [Blastosporella zonata]|nr:hypothetical protein C0991_006375 [Blastosporella zonata]
MAYLFLASWFLDNPDLSWSPPSTLLEFMDRARLDNKPLVYIGFGSITVPNPSRVTERIIKAVVQSDVRAIIAKGWSSRMSKVNEEDRIKAPPECYILDRVPHDWLFPKVDAALHHGGAGTTGASLRAGIPTLIKPWFGDQFFWGARGVTSTQSAGWGFGPRVDESHYELVSALGYSVKAA